MNFIYIAVWVLSMACACEAAVTIADITPVKPDMTLAQAREAVKSYLKTKVFIDENRADIKIPVHYKEHTRAGQTYNCIDFNDGTKWVQCAGYGFQRLAGALYLKDAIAAHALTRLRVVDTKFTLRRSVRSDITITVKLLSNKILPGICVLDSDDFISFSKYCGDTKPGFTNWDIINAFVNKTGFVDLNANANLRIADDGIITVIDTEYRSFSSQDLVTADQSSGEISQGATFTYTLEELA